MKASPKVEYILEKALGHEAVSREEAVFLLKEIDPLSPQMYALMGTANQLTRKSSDNRGEVHAQVGVNIAPCPHSCGFCSFGAQAGLFRERVEMSPEEVAARAKAFVAEGANVIYLMTTGSYDFGRFLEVAQTVRASIPADIPLVANIDDFGPERASRLVKAGFQGAYHTIRMGEGRDTSIPPERRLATMRAIVEAGLRLAYCVEPVGPEHSSEEIVEKAFIGREYGAWFSGAMRRTPVAGTALAGCGTISELELAKIVAVVRLVMGDTVKAHCTHEPNVPSLMAGANLVWAESGANPRDSNEETAKGRGLTSGQCAQLLQEVAYEVGGGPPASLSR